MFLNVQICRLCLKKNKDNDGDSTRMVLINGARELLDMIYKATSLRVAESRRQPKQFLCNGCEKTVRDFAEFRKKCIVSDSIFRRVFFLAAYTDVDRPEDSYVPKSTNKMARWAEEGKSKRRREDKSPPKTEKASCKSSTDYATSIEILDINGDFSFETETDITLAIETEEPSQKNNETVHPIVNTDIKPETVAVPGKTNHSSCTVVRKTNGDTDKTTNNNDKLHTSIDNSNESNDKARSSQTSNYSSVEMKVTRDDGELDVATDDTDKTTSSNDKVRTNDDNSNDGNDKTKGSNDQHSESSKISNNSSVDTKTSRDDAEMECADGGTMLSSKRALLRHQQKHSDGELAFTCDICLKSFRLQQSLQIHLLTHSGVRPYKCKVCSKRFTTHGSLMTHSQTHTGMKTFQCDKCDKAFRLKSQLKVHLLTHTGERTYKCNYCEKLFITKGMLVLHAQTHNEKHQSLAGTTNSDNEGKANRCEICGKEFALKIALKTHMKMHAAE